MGEVNTMADNTSMNDEQLQELDDAQAGLDGSLVAKTAETVRENQAQREALAADVTAQGQALYAENQAERVELVDQAKAEWQAGLDPDLQAVAATGDEDEEEEDDDEEDEDDEDEGVEA
jgi:hypothetical protein